MVVETQHAASLRVGYIAGGSPLPIIGVHAEDWTHYKCRMFSDLGKGGIGRRRRIGGSRCGGCCRR